MLVSREGCCAARMGVSVRSASPLPLVRRSPLKHKLILLIHTLADISDFLSEEITGPGKFTTRTGEPSRFEEPAMNQLINDIFGDTYITLNCKSGECLRLGDVPGFVVSLANLSMSRFVPLGKEAMAD